MLLFLFFLSGFSALVYQVVWVREFAAAFGATIHTTSLVVAIFMLGLGVGSYLVGVWADRRYARAPESLLRAYAVVELLIAVLGLTVSIALPHVRLIAAANSSYVRDAAGWFVLSARAYAAQGALAVVLLAPVTLLMGGTLTLLIRHLVRSDVDTAAGWKVATLYAVNTIGAAAGALLTDFALVPAVGLRETQIVAVALNVLAGTGAWLISRSPAAFRLTAISQTTRQRSSQGEPRIRANTAVAWIALALLLSGFAGMGMEIVWIRHFTILLGGFRSVFSLVLTVMLAGLAIGSWAAGALDRRVARPVQLMMAIETLFVVFVLVGLASNSFATLDAERRSVEASLFSLGPLARRLAEFWYNARPILIELGVPSLLIGATFPLGNAVIQHAESLVGGRAGILYLINTAGAVCGSLAAGYVLLPRFGMQGAAAILVLAAGFTLAPLYAVSSSTPRRGSAMLATIVSLAIVAITIDTWLRLPGGYLLRRAMPTLSDRESLRAVREGVTEVVAVTEIPGRGRSLMTNGHAMSSTAILDQRYMRALVHIPLLSMDRPSSVLVVGFGVGNSAHAATLHPSVTRVEVADLSRDILEHARFFRDANHDILRDPRVQVYVNDGRQHLQMQAEGAYDLITLEPPPIAHAGVGALYSREFYELARSRLKPGGYLSQWLPAYQVPPDTALAMVRAFVDVFPQSVLLSGTRAELLLLGVRADRIEIDPDRIARALDRDPLVRDDLKRIDLGSATEIVGTFVASANTLAGATRASEAVTDDRPLQEYGVRSSLVVEASGVPASLVDLATANQWCPKCFNGEEPAPAVAGLDAYLALMDQAYRQSGARVSTRGGSNPNVGSGANVGSGFSPSGANVGSGFSPTAVLQLNPNPAHHITNYLASILPDTGAVHNIIGVTLLREGRNDDAADEFRAALARDPKSPDANRNLGTALAATGHTREAIDYLERAVQLAPDNEFAKKELEETKRALRP